MSSYPNLNNGKYTITQSASQNSSDHIIRLHVHVCEVLNIRNRILYY